MNGAGAVAAGGGGDFLDNNDDNDQQQQRDRPRAAKYLFIAFGVALTIILLLFWHTSDTSGQDTPAPLSFPTSPPLTIQDDGKKNADVDLPVLDGNTRPPKNERKLNRIPFLTT
jgi:hypothetical protein